VSETTEEELRAYSGGPKPDLVPGIEPAYTLPSAGLSVRIYFCTCFSCFLHELYLTCSLGSTDFYASC
jgi:hypothetical protein